MTATSGDLAGSTEQRIERFLDDWLADRNIPGVSVAVFDADGIQYTTGLGARDLDETAPATPDTLYYAGSITKTATAVAVLQLVERDAVALDDAVADHVPFLADAPGDPVTVHELLTHTSGVPAIGPRENIVTQRDLQLNIDGGAAHRVTDDPPYMYNNAGYKVLGELVAAVDGRPYTEYVAQEILAPLGMERSTFDQQRLFEDVDATPGYQQDGDDHVPAEEPMQFVGNPANGGLISSVTELPRLLRCLLEEGRLDGTRVLASESVAAMTDRHARCLSTLDGEGRWYGYGVSVDPFLGDVRVGHSGSVGRSMAYVGGLADRRLGVALAVNRGGVRTREHAHGVLALAAGEDPVEEVPWFALEEKLAAVAGTYEAYRGPTATVEADGSHLTIEVEGRWRDDQYPAFPTSLASDDYTFYAVEDAVRTPIEFRETEAGMTLLESRQRFDET